MTDIFGVDEIFLVPTATPNKLVFQDPVTLSWSFVVPEVLTYEKLEDGALIAELNGTYGTVVESESDPENTFEQGKIGDFLIIDTEGSYTIIGAELRRFVT